MKRYSIGPDNWPVDEDGRRASYWELRKELVYYHTLGNFVRLIGYEADSLLDVGSAHCEYIRWFDWIPERVSLDIAYPTSGPGIRSIKADFLEWKPDKIYDVVLCMQVLEHIDDAARFAQKLLTIGKRVLISVPHKWSAGGTPGHVQDPVSQDKVDGWFGRRPDYAMTVREPFAEERLFCYYNISRTWMNITQADMFNVFASRPLMK